MNRTAVCVRPVSDESMMPQDASAHDALRSLAETCHPACIACRDRSCGGLGLRFKPAADGGVTASFLCAEDYQGYPDRLHGGIVALLLDAAMTHCLFARDLRGFTANLNVRYRRPVALRCEAAITARVIGSHPPLYVLRGEIRQGGVVRAVARGSFRVESAASS